MFQKRLHLLQVLVCIFLWLIVDVIKTMAAKLMAGHFHQETYFQRMQEALRKVLAPFELKPSDLHTVQPVLHISAAYTVVGHTAMLDSQAITIGDPC